MRTYWFNAPKPGNMGDMLTQWILKSQGITPELVTRHSTNKLLMAGSIIAETKKGDDVYGSGMLWKMNTVCKQATYHAVRGPITRQAVIKSGCSCGPIGDPGLLMPMLYPIKNIGGNGPCIVPHLIDTEFVQRFNLPVVSLLGEDPTVAIENICKYDLVFSSSLHGIILAHAYGIPAVWVRFCDKLAGDDSKFDDYYLSVGLKAERFKCIHTAARIKAYSDNSKIQFPDINELWDARPWKK